MIWPGMGDPTKRRQTIKFLLITAGIAISVGAASSVIQSQFELDNPLKQCIDDRNIKYKISFQLELIVDKKKAEIPAGIGISDGCTRSLYTLSDDGVIFAEWDEEYDFELGHFLWIWDFPLRDMDESKQRILVNGFESPDMIHSKIVDGYHYTAEFTSKAYDQSKDSDFLPPEV